MGTLEDELREMFAAHVAELPVVSDPAGRAISEGTRIRRTRSAIGASAVVMVVALAGGGVIAVNEGLIPIRSVGLAEAQQSAPASSEEGIVGNLPHVAERVRTDLVYGSLLVTRDGAVIRLAELGVPVRVYRSANEWLVIAVDRADDGVSLWRVTGADKPERMVMAPGVAVNDDASQVAWGGDGSVSVAWLGRDGQLSGIRRTAGTGALSPYGFADDAVLLGPASTGRLPVGATKSAEPMVNTARRSPAPASTIELSSEPPSITPAPPQALTSAAPGWAAFDVWYPDLGDYEPGPPDRAWLRAVAGLGVLGITGKAATKAYELLGLSVVAREKALDYCLSIVDPMAAGAQPLGCDLGVFDDTQLFPAPDGKHALAISQSSAVLLDLEQLRKGGRSIAQWSDQGMSGAYWQDAGTIVVGGIGELSVITLPARQEPVREIVPVTTPAGPAPVQVVPVLR